MTETKPSTELQTIGDVSFISATDMKRMVTAVQEVMKTVMIENEHYGVIPGTKKPTLFKAGAEKLAFTFRLSPRYNVEVTEKAKGHFVYHVKCSLFTHTDRLLAEGVGSCSSMESKYRWRWVKIPVDTLSKEEINGLIGQGLARWAKFGPMRRIENFDIEDVRNTVEKMAAKRALVAAVLNGTATSDIFTQDMEDSKPADKEEPSAVIDVSPQAPGTDKETPPAASTSKPRAKAKPLAKSKTKAKEGEPRLINAKFDSDCAGKCGAKLKVGEKVWYEPGKRGVKCEVCGAPQEEAEVPFDAPAEAVS